MNQEPQKALAATPKRTLAQFLDFIPKDWQNADLGIEHAFSYNQAAGYHQVKRVILTVDASGRRCVIFSAQSTQLIL